MSFPPVALGIYFPEHPGDARSSDEGTSSAHSQHSNGIGQTQAQNHPPSSPVPESRQKGSSELVHDVPTTHNDAETHQGCESDDDEAYDDYEQGTGKPSAPSKNLWLSGEERVRVAFKRARNAAEKMDLDRSPFFPRSAAEYAGLKAEMLEAKAARLSARIAEKERGLRAKEEARWTRVFVVGAEGQIEEKRILVYSSAEPDPTSSNRRPDPKARSSGTNASDCWIPARDLMGHTTSIEASDSWIRPSSFYAPTSSGIDTFNSHRAKENFWATSALAQSNLQAIDILGRKTFLLTTLSTRLGTALPRSSSLAGSSGLTFDATTQSSAVEGKTERSYKSRDWLGYSEDDDTHSETSSFTPDDYRPDHHTEDTNEVRNGSICEAPDRTTFSGRALTPVEDNITIRNRSGGETLIERGGNADGLAPAQDNVNNSSNGTGHSDERRHNNDSFIPNYHHVASPTRLQPLHPSNSAITHTTGTNTTTDSTARCNATNENNNKQQSDPNSNPNFSNNGSKGSSTRVPPPPTVTSLSHTLLPLAHRDGLSPVLALPNPFTPTLAAEAECDWPSYAEYTSEGDGRVKRWEVSGEQDGHGQGQIQHARGGVARGGGVDDGGDHSGGGGGDAHGNAGVVNDGDGHGGIGGGSAGGFSIRPDFPAWPEFVPTAKRYCLSVMAPFPLQFPVPLSFPLPLSLLRNNNYNDNDAAGGTDPATAAAAITPAVATSTPVSAPTGGGGGGVCGGTGHATSLGRFLPVPRFRSTVDPRLELTQQEIQSITGANEGPAAGNGAGGGSGTVPWEMRAMAGERWDFHRERRLSEAWGTGFAGDDGDQEAEEGWDMLEGGGGGGGDGDGDGNAGILPGVRMAWELVGRSEDAQMEGVGEELMEDREGNAGERVEVVVDELLGEVHEVLKAFGGAY